MTTFTILVNATLATIIVAAVVGPLAFAVKTAYRDEVSRLPPSEFREAISAFYQRTPKRLRQRAKCLPPPAAHTGVPKRAAPEGS